MPDFDFDAFNHEYDEENGEGGSYEPAQNAAPSAETPSAPKQDNGDVSQGDNGAGEQVDKW